MTNKEERGQVEMDVAPSKHPPGSMPALVREGLGYGVVGLLQIALDWAVFFVLTYFGVGAIQGNVAGRIFGALLGFWLNGRFTFAARGARLGVKPMLRFLGSWALMTIISTVLVSTADAHLGLKFAWLAKPVIDLGLAAAGFLASRHWIYK